MIGNVKWRVAIARQAAAAMLVDDGELPYQPLVCWLHRTLRCKNNPRRGGRKSCGLNFGVCLRRLTKT